jgi:manganese transport protein
MREFLLRLRRGSGEHKPRFGGLEILKYIGPGFLVTVGFIDPGNWAANVAAGADFGYALLWMVTLSTIMLILLQHNVAHLGIATGLCLAEAAEKHLRPWASRGLLGSAMVAVVATALAELLGAAIGLQMLFRIPLPVGVLLTVAFVLWMLLANTYRRVERIIIGFVGLIGLSFVFEVIGAHVPIAQVAHNWVVPSFPPGSIPIIMAVLGAVVMPHNLYLHSEIIQSRQWNLTDPATIARQLRYEFLDTLASMGVGWAINSAMILVAAAVFFFNPGGRVEVTDIQQAQSMLAPFVGNAAGIIFALALLFAGLASSVTAAMAGGSIYAGMFGEPYDIKDPHSRWGVLVTIVGAGAAICAVLTVGLWVPSWTPFTALIASQVLLSIQLPWTIFMQIYLTSSRRVMGDHANSTADRWALWAVGVVVAALNVLLLVSLARGGG